jgi:hypothetical protein
VKVVLVGAGSYVFAPTVLRDAIVKHLLRFFPSLSLAR